MLNHIQSRNLTYLFYLLAFIGGCIVVTPGTYVNQLTQGNDTYKTLFTFLFTFAQFFSMVFLIFFSKRFKSKTLMIASVIVMAIASALLSINSQVLNAFLLFSMGSASIILFAKYSALLILIQPQNYPSKLQMLFSFFGLGAVSFPFIIASIFDIENIVENTWIPIWTVSALLLITLVLLKKSNFPVESFTITKKIDLSPYKNIITNSRLIRIGLMVLFYAGAEFSITMIIINYFNITGSAAGLKMNLSNSANIVSIFWFFVIAGRIIISKFPIKGKLNIYTALSSFLGFLFLIFAFNINNKSIVFFLFALIGLSYSHIYGTILTMAISEDKNNESIIVNYILLMGSVGCFIFPSLISVIGIYIIPACLLLLTIFSLSLKQK